MTEDLTKTEQMSGLKYKLNHEGDEVQMETGGEAQVRRMIENRRAV